ncbi:S8 family serine peptidase, partial [Williamwhitmania taraxaci]
MKKFLLLLTLVTTVGVGWAQRHNPNQYRVTLNENSVTLPANFQDVRKGLKAKGVTTAPSQVNHFIMQFNSLPTVAEQKQLKEQGITLLNYLQGYAYYVSVSSRFYSISRSASKNIRSFIPIKPEYKIRQDLAKGNVPDYAKAGIDIVKVDVTYFKDVDETTVAAAISKLKITSVKMMGKFHMFSAEVSISNLATLSSLDWVMNIEPIAPPSVLDNDHGKSLHRANVLSSSIPGLGYGLTGKGVKIGLWDGDVYNHRDFNDRLVVREFESHRSDHGTHTGGTITGAGLLDPRATGMAPEAQLYAWNFNVQSNGLAVPNERLLALDNDGIEITSNSWGYNVTACPNPYAYNSTDHNEDLIAGWYPYFLYVFSAGNNQSICPGGFNTTSKNMKNSLMVAAVDELDGMSYFSSFGPSEDGRLIPNISGDGVDVYSTFFDNGYGLMSGTSMATPGVAGTMALVYQRYKDTHGGQQPASSLMRGLACNTAHDLGNFGPDYKYGFGEINGLRAVSVMEQNHYFIDTVSQGNTYTKDITVPSGAVGLKVMLSWTDPTGTVGASRILVNDLDLSVSNGGSITLPWVLDPANPSATAVRDYDGLNNLEQVTFSNPTAGTYTIGVDGFEIADGVQEFAVVYDIIMPTLKLTYPIGGENLSPGSEGVIRWDCEGYSNTFTIEYSADGGVNYSVIASNIPSSVRSYLWTLPAGTSSNAKIRISNGSVLNATKGVFNVMPVPQNIKVGSAQCGGAGPFALTWDVVANAKYEVLKLNGQVYEHLADVASNSYDITGITQSNNNWYCVRAIDLTTGAISERSLAVTVNPTVAVSTLPFIENFESQKTDNFYFTSVLGQGNVRYVNNAQKYGIRLEGTSGPTTAWLAGTDAACFTNNPNFVVKASICNIDATSLAGKNFRLKFDYRQKYRTAAGTSYFRVRVNGDILTNTDGTQIYGATNQVSYKSVYYDLAAYAGMASVVVEFEAVCKTNYTTYVNTSGNYDFSLDTYDVGDFVTIDNIEFLEPLSDMALTSLTVGAGNTAAETITVKVKNLSGEIVSDVPVSYTVNGGAVVSEVVPGPIAPIAEATYAFTQTADFSVGGVYSVVAAANWPNDPIASNNSMTAYKANNGTDILIGTGTPTTTCDGWLVDNAGRYADYAVSQTKTHRFIPGTAGKNVKITFTEFATEEGYDFVYVYNGNSTSAANLLGKFAGSALPPSITSSSANGNLTIKFTSDFDVNDMGFVAHIECVDKPAVDAAVTAITAPTASGIKTTTETVTFTLFNYGLTALTTYDMYYQIDNNTPVIESVTTDNIASATSLVKSFAVKADLSIAATYALKVWVVAVGDAIAENDSTTVSVVSLASTADAGVSAILTIRPSRVGTSTIAATIKNFGTTSISNFDVAYAINGDAEVVQAVVGPIAAGATSAITFTTKADFTAANNYNVDIYTKLAGDVLATNDTMSTQVVVVAPSALNVVGSFYGGLNVATASAIPAVDLVNNYTIEAWVNLSDPTNYGNIFNKTNVILDYTTTYGVAFYGTNSYLLRVTGATSSFIRYVPNSVKKGTWQHVALTVSSTNVYTLYIDGVAQTWTVYSGAAVATKTNSSNPISIGNRASDLLRPVNGLIDEVRVWNSCLDQSTISGNMMTDYAANTAGLLAYYKIKEGAGSYLFDYSSNDNTAIISGADVSGMGDGKFWNAPGLLLKNFNFTGEKVPTTFDANTNTFTSIMDAADLSALTANFTPSQQSVIMIGAAVQTSGSVLDFTSGTKNYTAEGFGFNTGISQNYTVNVSNDLSSACDLTAYSFETADNAGLLSSIVLDGSGNNFYKKVSSSLDLTALKALFTISPQATLAINNVAQANPQSSVVDYSSPVMVTVVSRNGRDFKNYSITVDARSSSADLTAFSIPLEQVGTTTIDAVN